MRCSGTLTYWLIKITIPDNKTFSTINITIIKNGMNLIITVITPDKITTGTNLKPVNINTTAARNEIIMTC